MKTETEASSYETYGIRGCLFAAKYIGFSQQNKKNSCFINLIYKLHKIKTSCNFIKTAMFEPL